MLQHFYPVLPAMEGFVINKSTKTIEFPNGSRVLLRGLDTPERATKVLSQQFATVFFDEAQTIDYNYFGLLLTRLPQPKGVDYQVKVVCSANYAPKTHWTKIFFTDKLNPETKSPHGQQSDFLKFSTEDNRSIDAEEYLHTLNNAGDRKSRLMCGGDDWYEEIEGALWSIEDILRATALPTRDYSEIVLAFDPAVTNNEKSDAHGVAIAGKTAEGVIHVLDSYEVKMDVNDAAVKVIAQYHAYNCSKLVYETNQGADWIEALIKNHDASVYCEGVRAKRGKLLRAEPVAAIYKNQKVCHIRTFSELEDQMVTYCGKGDSPNSLDALVYAVKYLHENESYVDPDAI